MNQLLRLELMRRLTAAYPNHTPEDVAEMAAELEATGAYRHDGERVLPIGDRHALARASRIAPTVVGGITRDHVAACSASSSPEVASLDRARARLRGMGIDLDSALEGNENDRTEFYGMTMDEIFPKGAA